MGLLTKKDADYFRAMDANEFFTNTSKSGIKQGASPFTSAEFKALPMVTRREIMAGKFNMSWDQFIAIPSDIRIDMMNGAGGWSANETAARVAEAAEDDVRTATVKSFVKGSAAGVKASVFVVKLLFVFGLVYFFRAPIIRLYRSFRKGAA